MPQNIFTISKDTFAIIWCPGGLFSHTLTNSQLMVENTVTSSGPEQESLSSFFSAMPASSFLPEAERATGVCVWV